jgi:ABC-type nitrate/sulfonate/bicarbonate transport system substrate-binding protein
MYQRMQSAALCAALIASLCGAASAQAIKLRYGVIAASARNIQSVALTIARDKGFLAKEGIELDIVPLPGVEHMVDELDKGNVDVSFTATPYLINAVLKGSDAVAVIGGPANTIYSLVTKPGIKSFADLKGKTVAVSLPVDTISIATRQLLEKHGLKESDYTAKVLVGTPLRATCLEKGECDAAPLSQPEDFLFLGKGYGKLGDSLEVISELQFSVVAARRAWARDNSDKIVRFARAYAAAYRYMADPANREDVVATIARSTDATPDIARAVMTFFYEPDRGVMPKHAEISMAGLAKVIELLGSSGQLPAPLPPPEKFVDLSYLEKAGLK